MRKYKHIEYQISEHDGKYGVTFLEGCTGEPIDILQPIYASVTITNNDVPLPKSIIRKYAMAETVRSFGEFNCPIVVADGKYGLLSSGELFAPLEYDRIIKLTFCHYLCQKNATWELYHHIGSYFELQATCSLSDELTLTGLLETLDKINCYHPKGKEDTAALAKRLYKDPHSEDARYISEYRHYWGFQWHADYGIAHDFVISTERVILHDDFSITPYDRKRSR